MGLGFFLFVAAVLLLASLQYQADRNRLDDDYRRWKNNRR